MSRVLMVVVVVVIAAVLFLIGQEMWRWGSKEGEESFSDQPMPDTGEVKVDKDQPTDTSAKTDIWDAFDAVLVNLIRKKAAHVFWNTKGVTTFRLRRVGESVVVTWDERNAYASIVRRVVCAANGKLYMGREPRDGYDETNASLEGLSLMGPETLWELEEFLRDTVAVNTSS